MGVEEGERDDARMMWIPDGMTAEMIRTTLIKDG